MKKVKRALLTIIASVFVALQLGVAGVNAQSGSGLRISPLNVDLEIERGESATFNVSLTNVSNQPVIVSSIINDFSSDGTTGEPKIIIDPSVEAPNSLRDFITREGEINIEAEGSINDVVTVTIPESARPGSYYSLLRFEARPESLDSIPDSQVQFSLNASTGVIVLVDVPGEAKTSGEVTSVSARVATFNDAGEEADAGEDASFFATTPNQIAINVSNTGETFLRPFGKVIVKSMFGSTSAEYELNAQTDRRAVVLPDSSRLFKDKVDVSGFGRFTVEANIAFDQGEEVVTKTAVFWVLPIWLILVSLVLLAAIVFAIVKLYSKIKS